MIEILKKANNEELFFGLESIVEFWLWLEESINKVEEILKINKNFNFYLLSKSREIYWEELSIEKVIELLKKENNEELFFALKGLGEFWLWLEESINKVEEILKINKNFNFDGLTELRKVYWEELSIEEVIELLKIDKNLLYRLIDIWKFWLLLKELSIKKVIKILKINKNFNFDGLRKIRKFWLWLEDSINKVIEIIEKNKNFNFHNLFEFKVYIYPESSLSDDITKFYIEYQSWTVSRQEIEEFVRENSEIYEKIFNMEKNKIIRSINRLHEPVDGMSAEETVEKRKQIAKNLLDRDLCILLWTGWELFTSSFRDILIPELQERLKEKDMWLLEYINDVNLSWDMNLKLMTSIIERWVFDRFQITEEEWIGIYNLIKDDIFTSKENIVKFSLWLENLFNFWFEKLNKIIVEDLINTYENSWENIKKTISIIFIYSRDRIKTLDSWLLDKVDECCRYIWEDFGDILSIDSKEWLKDNKLETNSMFDIDVDGKSSFVSFSRELLKNWYKFKINKDFPSNINKILEKSNKRHDLDRTKWKDAKSESKTRDEIVWWLPYEIIQWKLRDIKITLTKEVNWVEVVHNLTFSNNYDEFVKGYIASGVEWYIQRGHSYHRRKLIDIPLSELSEEEKEQLQNRSNFVYIWSCWWMNDYTKISDWFGKKSDVIATTWTWVMAVNNPYVRQVFEYVANNKDKQISWKDVAKDKDIKKIFKQKDWKDYIVPWSLAHLLLKV